MSRRSTERFTKIVDMIVNRNLPWFVERRLNLSKNRLYYSFNRLVGLVKSITRNSNYKDKPLVVFKCGFHGNTGGAVAIASIANLLAESYQVVFEANAVSNFNRLLNFNVRTVSSCPSKADLFICDVTCDHEFMQQVKAAGNTLLVSCHGMRNASHGLDEQRVVKSLALADHVHFIGSVQQRSFKLQRGKYTIIPNSTTVIKKTRTTKNIGTVGDLDQPLKNAQLTVEIGLASNANEIHLWGTDNDLWKNNRVIVHPFETNRQTIYSSFDCLVFMSSLETFGLVIIEAMSAGIPCVLFRLPAYEHFYDSPGIIFVEPGDTIAAVEAVNQLLESRQTLAQPLRDYHAQKFSTAAVAQAWDNLLIKISPVFDR